ncbi:hypothetical protein ACFQ9X_52450 [Catenulispora yoronensis]
MSFEVSRNRPPNAVVNAVSAAAAFTCRWPSIPKASAPLTMAPPPIATAASHNASNFVCNPSAAPLAAATSLIGFSTPPRNAEPAIPANCPTSGRFSGVHRHETAPNATATAPNVSSWMAREIRLLGAKALPILTLPGLR